MDGLLIIDKPAGWTSHDVVARARRLLAEKRVGHTGTLDPFATGVLVLLVGRATKLAQFLSGAEKEYEAAIRLGYATETGDLTGAALPRTEGAADCARLAPPEIGRALAALRGEIEQVPPMYSAKKVRGRKLYELARQGREIERAPVRVRVAAFDWLRDDQLGGDASASGDELERAGESARGEGLSSDEASARFGESARVGESAAPLRANEDGTCDVRARVVCSAGTYVRALAESVGEVLGTGAHLAALRRTRAGTFHIADAVTLERLAEAAEAGRAADLLVPLNAALPAMPGEHLTEADARRVAHGMAVAAPPDAPDRWLSGARVRLFAGAGRELLAVAEYDAARSLLRPRVMLAAGVGGGK